MKIKVKTMLSVLTLSFAVMAGSAQAANPIMDYSSEISNYSNYLEARAYTDFGGCVNEWCNLTQIGVEMTVYENGASIWNSTDSYFNGAAIVGTSGDIPIDSFKSYTSRAYHWAYGDFFSWSDTTYSSM
ncbi:hypothetical protein [Paenibacillus sp. RC67]|uniref:hypothetical protein n=1 Tax=Paenibacillus sp. RC67 TaxID=3039392 RepID=UPI0024ACA0D1|nr:hypothetical protein [Paenibacillus sp. RC67]